MNEQSKEKLERVAAAIYDAAPIVYGQFTRTLNATGVQSENRVVPWDEVIRDADDGDKTCATVARETRQRAQAAITALSQEDGVEELRAEVLKVLEPFAQYAADQLDKQLPRAIADDGGTPIWGDAYSEQAALYVADLRAIRALCAKLKERSNV